MLPIGSSKYYKIHCDLSFYRIFKKWLSKSSVKQVLSSNKKTKKNGPSKSVKTDKNVLKNDFRVKITN